MDNVPWHEEVIDFVEQLSQRLPDYAMACEHEHSNCILLADKKFFIDGKWNTWIDYERFGWLNFSIQLNIPKYLKNILKICK